MRGETGRPSVGQSISQQPMDFRENRGRYFMESVTRMNLKIQYGAMTTVRRDVVTGDQNH